MTNADDLTPEQLSALARDRIEDTQGMPLFDPASVNLTPEEKVRYVADLRRLLGDDD